MAMDKVVCGWDGTHGCSLWISLQHVLGSTGRTMVPDLLQVVHKSTTLLIVNYRADDIDLTMVVGGGLGYVTGQGILVGLDKCGVLEKLKRVIASLDKR